MNIATLSGQRGKKRVTDGETSERYRTLMFIYHTGSSKPVCLIHPETVALITSVNVKRHYETKHKVFDQIYPLKSELREEAVWEPNMNNSKWRSGIQESKKELL